MCKSQRAFLAESDGGGGGRSATECYDTLKAPQAIRDFIDSLDLYWTAVQPVEHAEPRHSKTHV